jgi:hypothetical protein
LGCTLAANSEPLIPSRTSLTVGIVVVVVVLVVVTATAGLVGPSLPQPANRPAISTAAALRMRNLDRSKTTPFSSGRTRGRNRPLPGASIFLK